MLLKIRAGMVLVLIWLVPWVRGQTVPANSQPDARYLVLDETKIPRLRQELSEAAANGYHIVVVATKMKDGFASGLTIILEKNEAGTPAHEYTLLDDQSIGFGLAGRVNDAAGKGYKVVPHGGFEHKGHDYGRDFRGSLMPALIEQMIYGPNHVSQIDHSKYDIHTTYMLMEKGDSGSTAPCRYFLIAPRQTAFLENTVQGKNRIVAAEGSLWVLELCATGFGNATTTPEPLTIRSLPLTGKLEKDRDELNFAVADGFRVSYAAGPQLTLEKDGSPVGVREYEIVSNKSASSLQKRLNSTGEFRLISGSLWVKQNGWGTEQLSAVLEKMSGSTIAYRYQVLRNSRSMDLQKDLNKVANQGYAVRDLARDGGGITVVLETTR